MNVSCIICSDLLQSFAEAYTTTCGHIFHFQCLAQWLERSKTCPQCRSKCTEKSIHRVYFNITNTEGISEDPVVLQANLDSLKYKLGLTEKDVKINFDKYASVKDQNGGLRLEIKRLEDQEKIYKSNIRALKDQVVYFKDKWRDADRLSDEVGRLQHQIRSMDNVKTVIEGTREQVKDMLRDNVDSEALSLLVVTLKKELVEADRRKRLLSVDLKKSQQQISSLKVKIETTEASKREYQQLAELHKSCDSERLYLKQKISDLHKASSDNESLSGKSTSSSTCINRILTESPLPSSMRSFTPRSNYQIKSPTIIERVKIVQASDSPYLPVQSSSVGTFTLNRPKFTQKTSTNTYSIFPSSASVAIEPSSSKYPEYSYDGLGGHSKEERYPSGNVAGIKRSKSTTSTITSKKFKMLAPPAKASRNTED